ncbi:MAG: hypothetical protein L0Y48_01690 [Fusobacteria bacterium]|nr:hypothetical protein [Fusobacteriota bacterium]
MEKIIIFGTGKLAQMVYFLLKDNQEYEVVAFTAEKPYCNSNTFLQLPLEDFLEIEKEYPPSEYRMLTVLGGLKGCELRKAMYLKAKAKGYQHINYIHPSTIFQGEVELGENNIIFPNCLIGFSGKMGDNNLLREKVYLGHEFDLGSHIFIGVDCNIGGEAMIKDCNYLAMDTTITNNITIEENNLIGIGSLVLKSIATKGSQYYGRPAKERRKDGTEK